MDIKKAVKEKYGQAALRVASGGTSAFRKESKILMRTHSGGYCSDSIATGVS